MSTRYCRALVESCTGLDISLPCGAATLRGSEFCLAHSPRKTPTRITPANARVLEQLEAFSTNKQIAAALGITERTVKFHISEMLEKLHLRNRSELLQWWRRYSRDVATNDGGATRGTWRLR